MISSLVLANFPKFSRRLELARTTQAIAQSFRQAEGAALGVREFSGLFPAYGLHFDGSNKKQYMFFADLPDANGNSNHLYDLTDLNNDGRPDELVDTFSISLLPEIADLCAGIKSGTAGASCGLQALDAVFVRPNPDVFITANAASGVGGTPFSDAEIRVSLPTGECQQVTIWTTGQLTVGPIMDTCAAYGP